MVPGGSRPCERRGSAWGVKGLKATLTTCILVALVRHALAADASMKARGLASSVSPKRGRVLGYYTNWVQYRSGGYAFVPESINPMLFTNIAFSFAYVTPSFGISTTEVT